MLKKIAIQGERGSFAETAAKGFFSESIEIVYCLRFEDLQKTIENSVALYAVLPVENSIIGLVNATNQFLQTVSWQVKDTLIQPIRQNLVACSAALNETIKTVESHPAALAQCQNFFEKNSHLRQIASENTAASARAVIESKDVSRAAVASKEAAQIFGGRILVEDIQDNQENYTKFLLLKNK